MPTAASRSWTILCDFDGTISLQDATDVVLERFARSGWLALEAEWKTNRIGSRECMGGQVALLDAERGELDACIDNVDLDASFPQFVTEAQAAGHHLVIVSDGIDHTIRRCLTRMGLAQRVPIVSNRLHGSGPRDWRLSFPHSSSQCRRDSGTCKCAVAKWMSPRQPTLLIGDGASDFCVAGMVDLVFAKGRLIDHCLVNGIAHHPIDDFSDALRLLVTLQQTDGDVVLPVSLPA